MKFINYTGIYDDLLELGRLFDGLFDSVRRCNELKYACTKPDSLIHNEQHWSSLAARESAAVVSTHKDRCLISIGSYRLSLEVERKILVDYRQALADQIAKIKSGPNWRNDGIQPVAYSNVVRAQALLDFLPEKLSELARYCAAPDQPTWNQVREAYGRLFPPQCTMNEYGPRPETAKPEIMTFIRGERLALAGIDLGPEMARLEEVYDLCLAARGALCQAVSDYKTQRASLNEPQHQLAYERAKDDAGRNQQLEKQAPKRIRCASARAELQLRLLQSLESYERLVRVTNNQPEEPSPNDPRSIGHLLKAQVTAHASSNNRLAAYFLYDRMREEHRQIVHATKSDTVDEICMGTLRAAYNGESQLSRDFVRGLYSQLLISTTEFTDQCVEAEGPQRR